MTAAVLFFRVRPLSAYLSGCSWCLCSPLVSEKLPLSGLQCVLWILSVCVGHISATFQHFIFSTVQKYLPDSTPQPGVTTSTHHRETHPLHHCVKIIPISTTLGLISKAARVVLPWTALVCARLSDLDISHAPAFLTHALPCAWWILLYQHETGTGIGGMAEAETAIDGGEGGAEAGAGVERGM